MQRVFKTRYFHRWMRKTSMTDAALCMAVREMSVGLIDADIGGGLFKKRVPLPGHGKRGSTRTLIASNLGTLWFFVFGFEKNQKSNISQSEKLALQTLAADLLARTSEQLDLMQIKGELQEICHDEY